MSNNKIPFVASWLAWSMVVWLFMAAAIFGLQHDLAKDFDWWVLPIFVTPLAAFCAVKALRHACSLPRIVRVIFWMITLSGSSLIVLQLWGQAEVLQESMLPVAAISPTLVVLWLGIRGQLAKQTGKPVVHSIADCFIGAVWLAIFTGGTFLVFAKIYVPYVGHKAEARWVAIGRPMPEFEHNLHAIDENDSLSALTQDLRPFGLVNFYRAQEGETDQNNIEIPKEFMDFSQAVQDSKSDRIELTEKNLADYLDKHKDDFDRLYQGILKREPAIWRFIPTEGFRVRSPNFLAARKVSQIIYADALHRLENGDTKGAADAIAAGMKLTANLGEQNLMVSAMIRVAIEGLFSSAIARLPEDPDALKNLAVEVKTKRRQWLNLTQWECWELKAELYGAGDQWMLRIGPLPRGISTRLGKPGMQLFIYADWLAVADQVEIFQKVEQFAAADLGAKESEGAANRNWAWGWLAPGWFRAWLRVNLTLLRREQSELIRWSRTQMQAGKSGNLGELPSVVIPGSKWVITGDAATNSVSMKLTPAPRWTTETTVIDNNFFLLPLDGSKSWKFVNAH